MIPKLKKVVKPVEEPKKEEVKRTKVKVPKAKKYEDLPEIPDYERPELEVYQESEFEPSKLEKGLQVPLKQAEKPTESQVEGLAPPAKNGLPKVCNHKNDAFKLCVLLVSAFPCHRHFEFPQWFYVAPTN